MLRVRGEVQRTLCRTLSRHSNVVLTVAHFSGTRPFNIHLYLMAEMVQANSVRFWLVSSSDVSEWTTIAQEFCVRITVFEWMNGWMDRCVHPYDASQLAEVANINNHLYTHTHAHIHRHLLLSLTLPHRINIEYIQYRKINSVINQSHQSV